MGGAAVIILFDGVDGFIGRGMSSSEEWPRIFARAVAATRALSSATRALSFFANQIHFLRWTAFGFRPRLFRTTGPVEVASDGLPAA